MKSTDQVMARQLNRAVHLPAATAGIDKRVTPHGLRRSFASHREETSSIAFGSPGDSGRGG